MIKCTPKKGVRYYSNAMGHRFWYFEGEYKPQGYPHYGKVTIYRFRDVCGCYLNNGATLEQFQKYFEVK